MQLLCSSCNLITSPVVCLIGNVFNTFPSLSQVYSLCFCSLPLIALAGKQNPEFNLRHDWNSILSDDPSLLMKHYSKDFFPHTDTMVGTCTVSSKTSMLLGGGPGTWCCFSHAPWKIPRNSVASLLKSLLEEFLNVFLNIHRLVFSMILFYSRLHPQVDL